MNKQCIFTNDNNVIIKLPPNNDNLTQFSHSFSKRNVHEVLLRRVITFLINNHIIDKNKNFIDLGAWIGDNALPWSKNINGLVYAIDPSSENCNYIKTLRDLNEASNVITIEKAISDKCGVVSTNEGIEHCSLHEGDAGNFKLQTTTLDTLHDEGVIENIGFMHLDVESMEWQVILGAQKIIQQQKPIICFEQHLNTDNYQQLVAHMDDIGYKSFLINELLPGCNPDCRNFLAIPKEQFTEELLQNINTYVNTEDVASCMRPYELPLITINIKRQ